MVTSLRRLSALILASGLTLTGLTACHPPGESGGGSNTVTIGTTDSSKTAWTVFRQEAEKEGVHLDVQDFSDYNTPNTALNEGVLDVNLFQHIKFLASYNVESNSDLVPVGSTEIVPLALFYKGHTYINDLKDGTSIAIPNDSTNQGRAINLLEAQHLVTLKKTDLLNPTPADIDQSQSKVSVTPVDAAQTATAWGEGTPAVVNNTYLLRAGIDPRTAIAADDPKAENAKPYINVLATRPEKKNDENIKKLVKAWHSDAVQKANAEDTKGTSVSVDLPANQLEDILKDTEKKTREES